MQIEEILKISDEEIDEDEPECQLCFRYMGRPDLSCEDYSPICHECAQEAVTVLCDYIKTHIKNG